ncbi:MAG: Sua5/YciO/YrdC/YwlC family protein, partial [Solirubrobacterales bacterium]
VYGVACDPGHREAHRRLCAMKQRDPDQPSAVMFFSLERALESLPEIGPRTHQALSALLPGAVLALLPNPAARFPLACGPDTGTLGVRVPRLGPQTAALEGMRWPILQTSTFTSPGSITALIAKPAPGGRSPPGREPSPRR